MELNTRAGIEFSVTHTSEAGFAELRLVPRTATDAVLHWGLRVPSRQGWTQAPVDAWPPGSSAAGDAAVRTDLRGRGALDPVVIRLDERLGVEALELVLFLPDSNRWDNNGGSNYRLALPTTAATQPVSQLAREIAGDGRVRADLSCRLGEDGEVAAIVGVRESQAVLTVVARYPSPLLLHWGVARGPRRRWEAPPESLWPDGTQQFDEGAVRTTLRQGDHHQSLRFELPLQAVPGVVFVLYDPLRQQWFHHDRRDFFFSLTSSPGDETDGPALDGWVETIVEHEMNRGSWTLMHRFNLAYELLESLGDADEQAYAWIFCWLRYSALRQLHWQRNYNTKPRELSHAQDRLTRLLADHHRRNPHARKLIRWLLSTLGRGGEGQRVRDQILEIMHRHRIKEVTGHFLEEWHQKLHNNTTPDDVAICQAYLVFLRSDGDIQRFYDELQRAGVTRERLRSFERPIVTDPDFPPHIRDGLIHDFESFLRTLRSVHDGTDLESALRSAHDAIPAELRADAWWIFEHRDGEDAAVLGAAISRTRVQLAQARGGDDRAERDRLSLDLALGQLHRVVIERGGWSQDEPAAMVGLLVDALVSMSVSWGKDADLDACIAQFRRLTETSGDADALWALRTHAAVEATARLVSEAVDHAYALLQPKAEQLGRAFEAEPWVVQLFSEEVVRGHLEFVVGLLLRKLDDVLRRSAGIPGCRVISRGAGVARGRVYATKQLRAVQGKSFAGPVVVVADHVSGDEELPPDVAAVLTRHSVDLVSHVAVRARNTGLVMVSVHDEALFDRFRALHDGAVGIRVDAAGNVVRDDGVEVAVREGGVVVTRPAPAKKAAFTRVVVPLDEARQGVGGGKSRQLRALRGRLPDWLGIPPSMLIPFAVFDMVLADPANARTAQRYRREAARMAGLDGEQVAEIASGLRDITAELVPPDGVYEALRETAQRCGIDWSIEDHDAWEGIKAVWASKWNDRAVLSRRSWGIADEDLQMAVLVQQVMAAEYSFVLHTRHPARTEPGWGYGEVVRGLGETLVGNHPGRALGFAWRNETGTGPGLPPKGPAPCVSAMPSKRWSLQGGGLIFRSDSSGEDIAGFAGAGLYESIQVPRPREEAIDYASDPLTWDDRFRDDLLARLSRIGQELRHLFGTDQDIEGTYGGGSYTVVQSRPQVG